MAVTVDQRSDVKGDSKKEEAFDPSTKPPFKLGDIRAAIPKQCWVKSPLRSMSYVFRDFSAIAALAFAAVHFDSWFLWPVYWVAQGTLFWALHVLGHDCGHGSFSDIPLLNSVVGHILHSFILVPFHGWRISHKIHHQNHGHVENDESWVPVSEKVYKNMSRTTRMLRYTLPIFSMLVYPLYLWKRSPGKEGSHFNPNSSLFTPKERKLVITSTTCWCLMLATLIALSYIFGPLLVLKVYGVPYIISVMWLDAVSYLHHHDHDEKLPWYRGKEWSYLRGGLTTIDRDYGIFNEVHHYCGTHVIHHLFPQIPHYHLVEATNAAKHVMGKYYREPKKSGAIPVHLVESLFASLKKNHYVSDTGDIVFYKTDPDLQDYAYDKSKLT